MKIEKTWIQDSKKNSTPNLDTFINAQPRHIHQRPTSTHSSTPTIKQQPSSKQTSNNNLQTNNGNNKRSQFSDRKSFKNSLKHVKARYLFNKTLNCWSVHYFSCHPSYVSTLTACFYLPHGPKGSLSFSEPSPT